MTDDYCLHPDLCGIGQDCSECHQNHVEQLQAEVARLLEENAKLKDENAGLEAAVDSLYWDNISLQESSYE
jgi:regulator of replication initiation timing